MISKEYILSNLPPGYVYIAPGEAMPEISYHVPFIKDKTGNELKDINNWFKYKKMMVGEKRNKDNYSIFIKAAPAPVVPAPKLVFKQITDINIGDVFAYEQSGEPVIINIDKFNIPENTKYIILGCLDSLIPFNSPSLNKEGMINYLNSNKYIYITSIAPQIEKTLKLARKMVLDSKKI